MTAEVPEPLIAIGATSRLDPQPKFVSATMMSPAFIRVSIFGVDTFERMFSELGLIDEVAIFTGNDDVGIDILSVFVRAVRAVSLPLCSSLQGVSSDAGIGNAPRLVAEAAHVAGEAR